MNERALSLVKNLLNPQVKSIEFPDDGFEVLNDKTLFRFEVTDPAAVLDLEFAFRMFWNCLPKLETVSCAKEIPADGYECEVTPDGVVIRAADRGGALNALKTLRQLAEPERGVLKATHYELPHCVIADAPSIGFRGIHICWFPETQAWQIERMVRLAAYYKYNYVVLETWGVYPFKDKPYLSWPGKSLDLKDLRRIIDDAKRLGVTMIPQFNMLGHASGSRVTSGKHVIQNNYPEYYPLVEPTGWSWCLTNPETRRVLTECALEMHDFFGKPEYFHIGFDEAQYLATCRTCRQRPFKDLLKEQLMYFHDLFAARNTKIMMWHDMLLMKEDPRWAGFVALGQKNEGTEDLYKEIPHDIIICDWQYDFPGDKSIENPPAWPTARFFKSEGFSTIICPAGNFQTIATQAQLASGISLKGMLQTTWSNPDPGLVNLMFRSANAEWNGGNMDILGFRFSKWNAEVYHSMNQHIRQVEQDLGLNGNYDAAGNMMQQTPAITAG